MENINKWKVARDYHHATYIYGLPMTYEAEKKRLWSNPWETWIP